MYKRLNILLQIYYLVIFLKKINQKLLAFGPLSLTLLDFVLRHSGHVTHACIYDGVLLGP